MPAWLNYNNPLVRDLAWTIGSPPLLTANPEALLRNKHQIQTPAFCYWPETSWFETQLNDYIPILKKLDKNPDQLQESLARRKSPRLGIYFEALLTYWLSTNNRYTLLHHNLPIREKNQTNGAEITVGEFDFIVYDQHTQKTLHWEVAIKYYLGFGDVEQPWQWFGPNKKDRLDLKLKHLLNKQIQLSAHPTSKKQLHSLGIHIDETWVILKGYLFYPWHSHKNYPVFLSSSHLKGHWQQAIFFEKYEDTTQWKKLDRKHWLCPRGNWNLHQNVNNSSYTRPKYNAEYYFNVKNKMENQRRFIVPENWL